ncbi:MAG: hypothetical protein ABEJ86_00185 [Halococcoides sp.]
MAVTLGRFASETLLYLVYLIPALAILLLAIAIGAGSALPSIIVGLAALPFAALGVVLGRLLGDGIQYVNQMLDLSRWTKALLGLVGGTGFYLSTTILLYSKDGTAGSVFSAQIPELLPVNPLQAYASVAFVPLGASGRPIGALVALAVVATTILAFDLVIRVETAILSGHSTESNSTGHSGSRALPRAFGATPSTRIAWRYLLRTRRDPRMLQHLMPLGINSLWAVAIFIANPGALSPFGTLLAVVGGGLLAGGAYCLNPLGDDRKQLPLLLTSTPSVAVLLRGRALAGATLGLAIALGVVVPVGIAESQPLAIAQQSLFAVFFTGAATGTALGFGAQIPNFERRAAMSVERPHPSMFVMMVYLFCGGVVGVIGALLVAWTAHDPGLLSGTLLTGYGTIVGSISLFGYLSAVNRFEQLTLDDR